MEAMELMIPTEEYAAEIASYREEFLEAKSSMDGCGCLAGLSDPMDFLCYVKTCGREECVPEGFVPASQFVFVRKSDDKIVGMIQIRHRLKDDLRDHDGHIGYSVRPSERRKGYAKAMLKASFPYCRELGLERVLVCCYDTNEASRKTIISNGGVYENTVVSDDGMKNERYWIEL